MSDAHNFDYDGIKYRIESRPPLIFTLLFTVLIIWGVSFMGYYLFSGWSSTGEYTRDKAALDARKASAAKAAPAQAAPGNAALGATVFAERCAACHGANAKGNIGPDLTRKEYKYGKSADAIRQSISGGRPGGMPGFGDLSKEKLEGVVQYLLSL